MVYTADKTSGQIAGGIIRSPPPTMPSQHASSCRHGGRSEAATTQENEQRHPFKEKPLFRSAIATRLRKE